MLANKAFASCTSLCVGLTLALGATARAEIPYRARITAQEVEARSGPGTGLPATGKLYLGQEVTVIKEEEGGWLAITPPARSYSWINKRFLEIFGKTGTVHGDQVPLRVGQEFSPEPLKVERVKVTQGTQVIILDSIKPYAEEGNGTWVAIAPVPQEVRYIPASAIKTNASQVVTTTVTPSPHPEPLTTAPLSASAFPGSAALTNGEDPAWMEAERAEQAGNTAEAIRLFEKLGRETHDHDLAMRCFNRSHFLRQGIRCATAPVTHPSPTPPYAYHSGESPDGRLVPVPASAGGSYPPSGQVVSQHHGERQVQSPRQAIYGTMASGPGILRRARISIDAKTTYLLETSPGIPPLFVVAKPGLNLEPYLDHAVDLYGAIVYRTEVQGNCMTAERATPVP